MDRILLFLSAFGFCANADTGFILMSYSVNEETVEICSEFNPSFAPYPIELDNTTEGTPVVDLYPQTGCEPPEDSKLYAGKIAIVKRHENCTFSTRARNVQKGDGKGVLVVSETGLVEPHGNESDYKEIDITLSLITNDSYEKIHLAISKYGVENVLVKLYSPKPNYWDPNALIMWLLAVFTCAFGAWSQSCQYASQLISQTPSPSSGSEDAKKDEELNITVVHALVFFGMCSVSILLMYFFYQYLVYVFIGIFCIASCFSTYDFFANIFEKSPCFTRHRLPSNSIPLLKLRPPILSIILFLSCAGLAIFWAVNRKEPYAWILQDILGFTFCIHMIKQLRLPSFKISSILLILFFIYDIFYVFVTPFLTPNNESIMVNIATGGGGKSNEELPMLFKLPRFGHSPYSKCGPLPYSLLGYGDIILPGLHVGFCAVWDFRISNTIRRHAYFIAAVIGYGTGLILTFVGMYLMMMGQPALLYLAPCCLLSTLIVALKRGELRSIWAGTLPNKLQVSPQNDLETEQESLLKKNEV